MDPHDLVLSKLGAGREKDFDFAHSTARLELVRREELLARLGMVVCSDEQRLQIASRVYAMFS